MKSRFIPEDPSGVPARRPDMLVDPPPQQAKAGLAGGPADPYDASEEQFAASLEGTPALPAQRFIVDKEDRIAKRDFEQDSGHRLETPLAGPAEDVSVAESGLNGAAEPGTPQQPGLLPPDGAWRQEVAAKLSRYRARRRLPTPRYPSLQLRFEAPDAPSPDPSIDDQAVTLPPLPNRLAVAIQEAASEPSGSTVADPSPAAADAPDPGAKILEFPRFFSAPRLTFDELAEPVFDRPRILEVPEQMPPPPALGGILIEPEERTTAERRPGFELPLNPPPMARRLTAGVIDLLIVGISFAAFANMFFQVTHAVPPFRQAAGVCAELVAVVWIVYQYLFLVYPGATPGLKLARLQLSRFDGTPAPRSLRRWRVLASVLSGLSLALGYAWCFFDEDQLCWHDRITHTYVARVPPTPRGTTAPEVQ